jgi:lactoylglutathione lyase
MKFLWCTLHVKSLEASLQFYQDVVGLDLSRRFGEKPGPLFAFLGGEGSEIELIEDGRGAPAEYGKDISLGFEVANLDEIMAFVREKGIPVHSGPVQPNPYVRFFFVQDPDGLLIQFVENMP